MIEEQVEIVNKLGLHARAATKFANTANKFSSDVSVCFEDKRIDGKSIMALMLLAAAKGSHITILAEGSDAREAMDAILTLVKNKFDEQE